MTWVIRDKRQMRGNKKAPLEKDEQAAIVKLLEALGAKVYVLGTRRPKGDHQGSCQTPGIPDLYVFLPNHRDLRLFSNVPVWIEVKARAGRLSESQRQFAALVTDSPSHYVTGTCDDVQNWLVDHGWLLESQRRTG